MGFAEVTIYCRYDEERLSIDVEAGEDGKLLIGTQGIHLAALQHVIRCLLRQQLQESVITNVDVNGYQARRERGIVDLAAEAAKRAQSTGRTVILQAMSPADRRTVHTSLSLRGDVATESTGAEPNRKVVIKPISTLVT
tara:strand:- start:45 stop:461 length:417 start_codon:yes stop_codon:yes gene_type:complete